MKSIRPSTNTSGEKTKADLVYEHLRQLIREIKLPPGTHLLKDEIAAELGVSRAPVSEAIIRLEEEMLVDVFPRYGSFVAPIRGEDLRECMFIRTALEVEAARRVAINLEDEVLKRLEDNLEEQKRALGENEILRLYHLDESFHGIFLDALGFSRAAHLHMAARVPFDRPRQFAVALQERAESTLLEHNQIFDAVKMGDPEFAGAAMRAHMGMASRAIEYGLSLIGDEPGSELKIKKKA